MSEPQTIEILRQRYEDLNKKRTQAETLLQKANEELEKLKAEAKSKFGTDDLAEMQKQLEQMEQENLKKRREYQRLLDGIEADLKSVEEKYAQEP
ncbi:MAG: hypothetical protein WAO58_07535 [Fimbriimonadaceae bacterium]